MLNTLKISNKIWLGYALLVTGYLISLSLLVMLDQRIEKGLTAITDTHFPFTQLTLESSSLFNAQLKSYEEAVMLGDEEALNRASSIGTSLQQLLERMVAIPQLPQPARQKTDRLLEQHRQFTHSANTIYGVLASGNEHNKTELSRLNTQGQQVKSELKALYDGTAEGLEEYLDGMIQSSKRDLLRQIIIMVTAMLLSFLLVQWVIRRAIQTPIRDIIATMRHIAEGDLRQQVELQSTDELGELGHWVNAFLDDFKRVLAQIEQSSRAITAASGQLHEQARLMDQGVSVQADRSAKIASASEQMAATSGEIADNTTDIANLAKESVEIANGGNRVVNQTQHEVKASFETFSRFSDIMQALSHNSQQIGQITNIIYDIAEQTNLLALNAAIEAARAGEHGRGFAVVASEVRMLAEKTTNATGQINDTIKAIQTESDKANHSLSESLSKLERGLNLATEAGTSLNQIVTHVSNLLNNVEQIAKRTDSLSASVQLVNSDISNISAIAVEATHQSTQLAQNSTDMAGQAQQLSEILTRFKV
ncbi:methyl-accepting chemotaxis protein [Ectothiorhodospiraceae bacterium BW-2]|nr:methyl-accepting chemotaxis protein [Ectothiorhodospiraceae bacterium BW-2]